MSHSLIKDFQETVKGFALVPDRPVLLAFSGGGDSVALFHLLRLSGIPFAAAHVNYGLRGEESDADALFCAELCERFSVPFFIHVCDADTFSAHTGIQEKARDIRYAFFRRLTAEHNFSGIFTAHHADDQAETVLLNLFRGTGLKGLGGMSGSRDGIFRPLLKFSKSQLNDFLRSQGFEWREDSSNLKNDYARNRLRNRVLPLLTQEFPASVGNINATSARLKSDKALLDHLLNERFDIHENQISVAALTALPETLRATALLHILSPYGIQADTAENLARLVSEGHTGKMILTPTHRFLVDRQYILISEAEKSPSSEAILVQETNPEIPGYLVKWMTPWELTFPADGRNAYLDADTLTFPLTWRLWQPGDRMIPLGMKGSKKVSDLLTDAKKDRFRKEKIHVLLSGGRIVWLEGIRQADSSKITADTSRVFAVLRKKC